MIHTVSILLIAALFLGLLLNLATENQVRKRLTGISALITAVIGVVLYAYGFSYTFGLNAASVFRALLAVCRMFAGINDFGAIQNAPVFRNDWVVAVFWMGHFLGFYVTASAAIAALGGKLLYKIRSLLLKHGDLLVIYGVSSESIAYAKGMQSKHRLTLLFVDDQCDTASEAAISAIGGIVDKSSSALNPDARFLRRTGIRPGKRRVLFAAMSKDSLGNLTWAKSLRSALRDSGVLPEQASLMLQGAQEQQAEEFLGDSGFGAVYAYDAYSLAARLMISRFPPCDTLRFDPVGKAEESFNAAIIGFGQMGRAVLPQLIMNGQFDGSSFRLDVFDPDMQTGSLLGSQLLQDDQLGFHACNGRSDAFYQFLQERGAQLKYIVLSTGDAQENQELAQELTNWYAKTDHMPVIVQISPMGLIGRREDRTDLTYREIYGSDAMDLEKMDHLAMIINQQYCGSNGKSAEENWRACDYFSRMSCRASADFAPAIMRAAGKTAEQIVSDNWKPGKEMLEHLAQTEHLRWCAFHVAMGYRTMDDSCWHERAEAYLAEKARQGRASMRIGKDTRHKLHACLIPWEALDELSQRENHVTGGHVDYKEMDRQNVLALPQLLRRAKES